MTRAEHIDQVLNKFPEWTAMKHRRGTRLSGLIVIEGPTGDLASFEMEVIVPKRFPAQDAHPKARILDHDLGVTLTAAAHVNPIGEMCVQMEERNEIDYSRDGLLRFMEQVVLHLYRARIWALTASYPGPEYGHFERGQREYRSELPILRARFDEVAASLPSSLRRLGRPRVPLPNGEALCPCGSREPFQSCHMREVLEVRRKIAELGAEPGPVRQGSRVPEALLRFLRSRR